MNEKIVPLSILSGTFGTVGSFFGKIAANYDLSTPGTCLFKVIFLSLMIISNTVGCGLFVKALNISGSSLPPTIASAASSYLTSAILGWLVFQENVTMLWWCGMTLILLGLNVMYRPNSYHSAESVEKESKRD